MDNTQQIVDLLKTLKSTYPYLRMGQIIINAISLHIRKTRGEKVHNLGADLFYVHDEELIKALKNYF